MSGVRLDKQRLAKEKDFWRVLLERLQIYGYTLKGMISGKHRIFVFAFLLKSRMFARSFFTEQAQRRGGFAEI